MKISVLCVPHFVSWKHVTRLLLRILPQDGPSQVSPMYNLDNRQTECFLSEVLGPEVNQFFNLGMEVDREDGTQL